MPPSHGKWPTRRGKRRPLDVVAAQEELARILRDRFLDAIAAEKSASSPAAGAGAGAGTGADATRHFTVYSKALDGLTKLQLETGELARAGPGRGARDAVPFGRPPDDYTTDEQRRMGRTWIFKDVTPPDAGPTADPDPAGDDA